MEKRALLAIVLCILILLVWQRYFTPKEKPKPTASPSPTEQVAQAPSPPESPKTEPPKVSTSVTLEEAVPSFPLPPAHKARDVVVDTPLYRATFTETGGRLKNFSLKEFRETIDKNSPDKELIRNRKLEELPLALNFMNHPVAALNLAQFVADQTSLTLEQGDTSRKLTFTYQAPDWLRITREYLFNPDSYLMDLTISVTNLGSQPWEDAPTLSLINVPFSPSQKGAYNFQGPALLEDGNLKEIKFKKIKEGMQVPGPIDWVAYTNQYFLMAMLPLQNLTPNHARLKVLEPATEMVESAFIGPKVIIQPGAAQEFRFSLYAGPKEVKVLKNANPKLAKAVNFGWTDIIAQPLLDCLKFFYRFTRNYGVAIILLTILIKLLFWPLTHKSYTSMRAMKKLQPKMAKIREKYKNDKDKMNQEIMQLYKSQKVNPLGGCLPMVLQIPVFFALYRVLYSSIAMRHAPFALWINDLSAPDRLSVGFQIPYLGGLPVLTLLMGLSMFVQQKMTPMAGDPRQEKMMLMMPVVFTFFFINFPSGLVLYWLVNNILSIGQQYYINKKAA